MGCAPEAFLYSVTDPYLYLFASIFPRCLPISKLFISVPVWSASVFSVYLVLYIEQIFYYILFFTF